MCIIYEFDCSHKDIVDYGDNKPNVTVPTHCNCKKCMEVELLSYGHGAKIPQQVK